MYKQFAYKYKVNGFMRSIKIYHKVAYRERRSEKNQHFNNKWAKIDL